MLVSPIIPPGRPSKKVAVKKAKTVETVKTRSRLDFRSNNGSRLGVRMHPGPKKYLDLRGPPGRQSQIVAVRNSKQSKHSKLHSESDLSTLGTARMSAFAARFLPPMYDEPVKTGFGSDSGQPILLWPLGDQFPGPASATMLKNINF